MTPDDLSWIDYDFLAYETPRIPLTEHCADCNNTGIFESGICHCGEEMEGHSVWDNHPATEMTGPCPWCERGLKDEIK
jgi:hypothetical protein